MIRDVLCHLAESSTLFSEVDDDTDSTTLRGSNAFFNGKDEVRLACANVRAKDVGTVAFVVHAQSQLFGHVAHVLWFADYSLSDGNNRTRKR